MIDTFVLTNNCGRVILFDGAGGGCGAPIDMQIF